LGIPVVPSVYSLGETDSNLSRDLELPFAYVKPAFTSQQPVLAMPTPESKAFLAKKPTVPPTFTGVDFLNNQAVYDARDAIIREQWVQQMMARLVREELGMYWIPLAGLFVEQNTGRLGGGFAVETGSCG
jgi:hypothetical protein